MPRAQPGQRFGGRAKGTPNKVPAALKEAILKAADLAGGKEGLIGYLKDQAKANPGPFMSLLGKVLPLTVAGDKENPLEHNHHIPATDTERAAAVMALLMKKSQP